MLRTDRQTENGIKFCQNHLLTSPKENLDIVRPSSSYISIEQPKLKDFFKKKVMSGQGVDCGIIRPPPDGIPSQWEEVAVVDSLFMYPMKSGKAIQVQEAQVRPTLKREIS